jgi:PAS domain S-box-containing protein
VNDRSATRDAPDGRLAALGPGLDLLGLPACVLDHGLRYLYVNAAYARQAGKTRAELMGFTPDEAFHRRPDDGRRDYLRRALAGEIVAFNRRTLEGPHQGEWFRAHYFPLRDETGAVWGVLVALVDVQQLKLVEAALGDRERQLSLITDAVGFPITYVDRSRVVRFVNRPAAEWSGRTPADMIGRHVEELMPPDVRDAAEPFMLRALAGESVTYEREALWPGREARHLRGHMIPDRDASGEVRGILIVLIDIEEDWRLRRALERQEAQLRHFAENIPGPIAVVDADYRYVFANKVFQRLRGLELKEIVGRHVRDVIGAEAAAEFFDPYLDALERGETCSFERRVGPAGGEQRWHLIRLAPIMQADGRFNGCYIVGSDIHDIKLGEERLQAQQVQLRLFADNIPDAVVYLDRHRRILFANRHFAALRGLTAEDIIGRTTAEVMGPDLAAWIAVRTQRVLERGEIATYERLTEVPGSGRRWFHVKAVPHFGESGEVVGMYVVGHDIHEVKEAQAQAAAREEELRFFAENIPEAMAYVDLERGCTFVNNLFLASRGLTREQALGRFPADVYPASPRTSRARCSGSNRPTSARCGSRRARSAGSGCSSRRGAMRMGSCAATTRSPPTSTRSRARRPRSRTRNASFAR